MKLIFAHDEEQDEYYAVDTLELKEYRITKEEFENKKLEKLDPDGNPRWTYSRWRKT